IECGVVPVHGNVDDPNAVEVNEKVEKRTAFIVGLEKDAIQIDAVEMHEALRSRNLNKAFLQYDTSKAFWAPKQLIDIIITNN
ncbi:hypothetical protein BU17DRAFT_7384, partial [Hysterangium stoloniferum]